MNMELDLDLNLVAFQYFDGFRFYNFLLKQIWVGFYNIVLNFFATFGSVL